MTITKYGRDLKPQHPPVPLPQLNDSLPPRVRAMIALLLKHQESLASTDLRTLVIQASGDGRMAMKATFDL